MIPTRVQGPRPERPGHGPFWTGWLRVPAVLAMVPLVALVVLAAAETGNDDIGGVPG